VGIPGTETAEHPQGTMVEVFWEQDDSGTLCISGHSHEVWIPPNVQLPTSSHASSHGGFFGQRKIVHGLVIDPDQIPDIIFRR